MNLAPTTPAIADAIARLATLVAAADAAGLHALADDRTVDASVRRVAHLRRQAVLARKRGNVAAALDAERVADRVMPAQW